MTVKEYIATILSRFNVGESDINFLITEAGLNSSDEVTEANKNDVKLALYKYVPLMIAGLSKVSEGGYTIEWNINGIYEWLKVLAAELGLPAVTPGRNVRNKSYLW